MYKELVKDLDFELGSANFRDKMKKRLEQELDSRLGVSQDRSLISQTPFESESY